MQRDNTLSRDVAASRMDGDTDTSAPATVWDVRLRKLLRQGGTQFELDVSFRTPAQRVVIFGPSGAGKTQTLRMIAGLGTPDEARVVLAGKVLCDTARGTVATPQERHLAYVFQEYALFPHLTVLQNVAFALRRGWKNPSKAIADEGVQHWMSTFQLASVAGHYPHQISGGQRQRTALARALVNDPRALLLDEPFAALDKGLRRHLRDELKALQEQIRLPMLLITHDDDDVNCLAEQVICIDGGKVVEGSRMADNTQERAW